MADQPLHVRVQAPVELDLDPVGISGDEHVLALVKMPVQADDVQAQLMEHLQVLRGRPQILKHLGVGVRRTSNPSSWALFRNAPNSLLIAMGSLLADSRQVKIRENPYLAASSM